MKKSKTDDEIFKEIEDNIYYVGVDPAEGHDHCAVTICKIKRDGTMKIGFEKIYGPKKPRMLRFLEWFSSKLKPPRVVQTNDDDYMSRWYLLGAPRGGVSGKLVNKRHFLRKLPINSFLHKFHRGDLDLQLHSHPWRWSIAIVLWGGYWEERRVGNSVIRIKRRPFSVNIIRNNDYHRVEL